MQIRRDLLQLEALEEKARSLEESKTFKTVLKIVLVGILGAWLAIGTIAIIYVVGGM